MPRIAYSLFTLLLIIASLPVAAQGFSGGFRAGLNFVTFDGPRESCRLCGADEPFETFNNTTGFHVGATFAYGVTDLFGVKADLMYSQKGGERRFEGPSYFYLYSDNDDIEGGAIRADLDGEIDVVNSYIDVPVTAYYRLGKLEIEAGGSLGLLVNSRASGALIYSNSVIAPDEEIIFNIDGSFFEDVSGRRAAQLFTEMPLPGSTNLPSVVGPYYNSNNDEPLYRRFDVALIGGLAYYLNNGLFLGVRYQHGVTDITDGENDLRLAREGSESDREFNTEDKDRTRSVQVSVGFRF